MALYGAGGLLGVRLDKLQDRSRSKFTHLCRMVEGEARGALNIVVPAAAERVVRTDNDLYGDTSLARDWDNAMVVRHTGWLAPGSFTVVNCSSLYFSKAGARSESRVGSETARDLMSSTAIVMSCSRL